MSCCGGGMWMMWLWAIVLVGLIVGGILVARLFWNRSEPDQRPSRRGGQSALDVLEERYARGEIDRDEFERRRSALSSEGGRQRA
jgi:putative membrane protein